jgi:ATP-dependent RNA helicase MSS116
LKDNTDCLAKAKTGTGKTLAFMIPTIEKILSTSNSNRNRSDISCLVISPTRELAQQIGAETEKLLTFHKQYLRKVVVCVGGTNKNKDVRNLQGTTPIVVATPGRLLDHLNDGLASRMANLDCLVFDEADQLLDMGFRPDIERILAALRPSSQTRQTLLFSATIPPSVSEIAGIAMHPKYHFVDTVGEDSEQTHERVQQLLMTSNQEDQIRSIMTILERETSNRPYKIIVFFTTARLTGFLAELFNSVSKQTGYKVLEIHSRKAQKARERASEEFRKSKNAVMFTSDVTARGMDYPDVTFVLQVGITDRAQYIHRLVTHFTSLLHLSVDHLHAFTLL